MGKYFGTILAAFLLVVAVNNLLVIGAAVNCRGDHEYYACGSACDTTCATLGQQCPIVNIRCNDACYCEDGYARDGNKKCIPIERCPENSP